jgi:hypothetical protein
MSRRTIIIIAFVVAAILTVLGAHYIWNHKVVPLVRLALWFPLPYLLHANEIPGLLLSVVQFPLLAWAFALAIRRRRVSGVLIIFVLVYALYAVAVIAILGPPR